MPCPGRDHGHFWVAHIENVTVRYRTGDSIDERPGRVVAGGAIWRCRYCGAAGETCEACETAGLVDDGQQGYMECPACQGEGVATVEIIPEESPR